MTHDQLFGGPIVTASTSTTSLSPTTTWAANWKECLARMAEFRRKAEESIERSNRAYREHPCEICGHVAHTDTGAEVFVCEHIMAALRKATAPCKCDRGDLAPAFDALTGIKVYVEPRKPQEAKK